jgi:hypothetical protein
MATGHSHPPSNAAVFRLTHYPNPNIVYNPAPSG